jgi:hypothetical protein
MKLKGSRDLGFEDWSEIPKILLSLLISIFKTQSCFDHQRLEPMNPRILSDKPVMKEIRRNRREVGRSHE